MREIVKALGRAMETLRDGRRVVRSRLTAKSVKVCYYVVERRIGKVREKTMRQSKRIAVFEDCLSQVEQVQGSQRIMR